MHPEPANSLLGRYGALTEEIVSVVEGEQNLVARMATVAAMLAQAFDQFYWTGFYSAPCGWHPEKGD